MADVKYLEGIQVWAYRRWLIYALENLLQNSQRVMADGGTITILGQRAGRWAEIRVVDTGPGVPESVRERLFKEPIAKSRGDSGMGIGDVLVATIVEEHEGNIALEKTGPAGTTVLIRLPVAGESGT
jgi:signal transduction histidine kinase